MQTDSSFQMTIEDVFAIKGRGTVVTGRIERGTLKVGDKVAIKRQAIVRKTVVAGIETFNKQLEQAKAGDNIGVLLKDIAKDDVRRGDVLTAESDASQQPDVRKDGQAAGKSQTPHQSVKKNIESGKHEGVLDVEFIKCDGNLPPAKAPETAFSEDGDVKVSEPATMDIKEDDLPSLGAELKSNIKKIGAVAAALVILAITAKTMLWIEKRVHINRNASQIWSLAQKAAKSEQYEEALRYTRELLDYYPKARVSRKAQTEKAEWEKIIADREARLKQIENLLTQTYSLKNVGRFDESLACISQILTLDNQHSQAMQLQTELKDLIERKRIEDEKEKVFADYVKAASDCESKGNWPDAIKNYEDAMSVKPDNYIVKDKIAVCWHNQYAEKAQLAETEGKLNDAIDLYTKALSYKYITSTQTKLDSAKKQLSDKIEAETRAREYAKLLKQGEDAERAGNLKQAVWCYSRAQEYTKEPLSSKIESLNKQIAEKDKNAEAIELKQKIESAENTKTGDDVVKPELANASDNIIVVVNGGNITESQLRAEIKPQLERMTKQLPSETVDKYVQQLRQQTIERMITAKLLDEQVEKAHIVVTDNDVDNHLKEMAAKQQPPVTVEDIKRIVETAGQNFDDVKKQIRKRLAYQKIMEAQWAGRTPTQQEQLTLAKEYIESLKAKAAITYPAAGESIKPVENISSVGKTEKSDNIMEKYAGTLKERTVDIGNGIKMEFVLIPAGEFNMGSQVSGTDSDNDEGPQHRVRIGKPFYMSKYEVTQKQYMAVMGSNPSRFNSPDRPVENVGWLDAMEFCRKLSQRLGTACRLPTEAQWEYACRAGTGSAFNAGETINTQQANYDGSSAYGSNYRQETVAVGIFPPNAFGLYDMHGNVWEWCDDWYAEDYYKNSPDADPQGPATGQYRVIRGGSWTYAAARCRSAARNAHMPDYKSDDVGFRIILETN